ncbi:MAG: T9SS type A sorting domain-containing protein [Chitinophagales bacterium]|jgi:hypothetical protein|nr:T9SS type A sorting domain-containing protein [Bacteroidota bacterium]MBL0279886.1 T9SS type A sorting domain-containing protein [Bacteroidota bacterium]
MKSNTHSNKKLLHYATSAAAFLTINNLQATVVYTDLDPDLMVGGEGGEISIDINSDGNDDFGFFVYSFTGVGTYYGINFTYDFKLAAVSAQNGNELFGSLVTYSSYSAVYTPVLPAGEGINSGDPFAEGGGTLGVSLMVSLSGFPYYDYQAGNWSGINMGYMGFRINIDKDHYYGWMRVSVNEESTLITIHDYAYENEANKAIFTGQTATAIEENPLSATEIYSNGTNVFVALPEQVKTETTVNIFDLTGKMVKNYNGVAGSTTLDCNDLPSGNYVVYVTEGELSIKKQVNLTK